MKTGDKLTINNNHRIYQVTSSNGKQWFCNIGDLNNIVLSNNLNAGYFKIYHFWNNKAEKLSQKHLAQMFEGSQLKQEFFYQSR